MRRILGGLVIIALVACAPSPTPRPSLQASQPAASPSTGPALASDAPPARPEPSEPTPDFSAITVTPSSRLRSGEVFLLAGLRDDIRETEGACRPRRADLPRGATDGVECDVAGEPAERVGAYLFPDDESAHSAYETRLREYGVDPTADGACGYGQSPVPTAAERLPLAACFVNEFDRPNLRMFWPGQSVLIGVLGRSGSVDDLERWARGRGDRRSIDVWEGGLGEAKTFGACPDATRPASVHAPLTLLQDDGGLVLTDPDGGNRRRLASGDGNAAGAEWSPDGRLIAYLGESGIWLLDPDGGQPRRLLRTGDLGYAYFGWPRLAWSPDGRRIAYMEWRTTVDQEGNERQQPSVWVVDIEDPTPTKVAAGAFLSWAPDASRLALRIEIEQEYDQHGPIAVADLDDGSLAQVGIGTNGDWSPDCRHLSLVGGYVDGTVVVHDGVGLRPRLAIHASSADWSPTSAELAVGTGDDELWVIAIDGPAPRRVASGGGPIWSDDGSMIAYTNANGLAVARADGSGRILVARKTYPLTGPVTWSADGRYLASSTEPTADTCGGPEYGWVIATDGSGVRSLSHPYHARWRPIDPSPPPTARLDDPPPKPSEGCGG